MCAPKAIPFIYVWNGVLLHTTKILVEMVLWTQRARKGDSRRRSDELSYSLQRHCTRHSDV